MGKKGKAAATPAAATTATGPRKAETRAGAIWGHFAALGANTCFGVGSVVIGLALGSISPLYFAMLRAVGATSIFLLQARFKGIASKDWGLLVLYGIAMFVSMSGYLVGIKLSNPVMAAIWQPTQPIFTLVLVTLLGIEPVSMTKVLGVLLVFGSCIYIVFAKPQPADDSASQDAPTPLWVNGIFVLACLGSASMVLLSKKLISKGHAFAPILGWASFVCAILMAGATYIGHSTPVSHELLCPKNGCGDGYQIPESFIFPFLYVVIFMTVVPYGLNSIAAQNLEGSVTSAYTASQPVTAACATVVAKTLLPDAKLTMPHHSMIWGVLGIFSGLALLSFAAKPAPKATT
eukprot:jgi/Bigna1/89778/estExt_fgenesh1_pg.C_550072